MDSKNIKELLETCFIAKKVTEQMPPLPKGLKTRHIHVIGVVDELSKAEKKCRISDISTELHTTLPSITKLVSELETIGFLKKIGSTDDKRTTFLELTDQGQICATKYVSDFHEEWAKNMSHITIEQMNTAIYVIEQLYQSMPKGVPTNE